MRNRIEQANRPAAFRPEAFAEPDGLYGPVYSWLWNAPLDGDTVCRQLDDMAEAGIRAVYVIPEPPEFRPATMVTTMTPPYLSPAFFGLIRLAVCHARALGMQMWIYDEGGWPSGGACGQLTKARPDLVSTVLDSRTVTVPPRTPYAPGGGTLAAYRGHDRVRPGKLFPAETELTEYFCRVANPMLPNLLEPETIPLFLEMTHQRYYDTLGDLADAVVPCVFTDEPWHALTSFPRDFPDRFREAYGYDLYDYLYVIPGPEGLTDREAQVRQDYAALMARLLCARFLEPIHDWCARRGLLLTGHLDQDHRMEQCAAKYANPLALLRQTDIPGIDVIWNQITPAPRPVPEGEGFFPRLAASAAAQAGKALCLSESFAVYGNGLTPEEMRWIAGYQFVRGIQILNPMTIPYSRDGALAYGERPYFCREIPGYLHLRQWNRHMGRVSFFLSCGTPTTDCALYLPLPEGLCDNRLLEAYARTGEALEEQGIDFDLIDREAIRSGRVENGALHCGTAVYRRIVVPEGVPVPEELVSVLAALDGRSAAPAVCGKPFRLRCRREEDGTLLVFVLNESTDRAAAPVTLHTGLPCYQADTDDGALYLLAGETDAGRQELTLTLAPGEEFLILATARPVPALSRPVPTACRQANLTGCVKTAEFLCLPEGIRRVSCRETLTPRADFAAMAGPDFSGEIVYRMTVTLTAEDCAADVMILAAERIEHSARVFVNGTEAGILALRPYRLALDPALFQSGENRLELEVANTAANRYGAADPHAWFGAAEIGPYHDREQAEERKRKDGGLFGPVTLSPAVQKTGEGH